MPTMLNLDDLAAKTERVLKFRGEQYEMKSMSVDEFINFSRETQKKAKAVKEEDMTIADLVESFCKMVANSFPTLPESVIKTMNLDQLNAIIGFARGDEDEEVTTGKKSVKKKAPKRKKKQK